ncbi:MAG: VCBS repeat-containing protein [Bryobacterales bacterium]|nr:VCBS repeat-containing protein [Bryobacterales bacterium]
MKELVWFENPTWQRHVLATGVNRMINVAPLDANSDGIPELLLAQEFANAAKNSIGVVTLLESNSDPRQPWKMREIDRLPTSHRLRPIRLRGGSAIVNAPLTGAKAEPPEYRDFNPVVYYRPPAWQRTLIDNSLQGVMHGIFVVDWNGDGVDELLTASFEGIHLLHPDRPNAKPEKLSPGDPAPWPASGASEIVVAKLGKERILASIDPWHGNQVSVHRRKGGKWQRQVIDNQDPDGHTLHAADLDGDGRDELIAGFRGATRSVYFYKADAKGQSWTRTPIDKGNIAAAGCAIADFDADRRLDAACIGSATANLKLYKNLSN